MSKKNSLVLVRALLVDLSGTVHIEDEAIEGAVNAVKKVKDAGIPIKFVTNTTKVKKSHINDINCTRQIIMSIAIFPVYSINLSISSTASS